MIRYWAALFGLVVSGLAFAPNLSALSIEARPLTYDIQLPSGESNKGHIDVKNTSAEKVRLLTEVQAFRQTDDSGSLEFYDDAVVKSGILPDLSEFELSPGEALRMYFLVDGKKLPSGNVFAAIFFRTVPTADSGVKNSIRIGTLLSIVNKTPSDNHADIKDFSLPFWQPGGEVKGEFSMTNTSDPTKSTGFYPEVTVTIAPFQAPVTRTSNLVFAGRTRTTELTVPAPHFGLYLVTLSYDSQRVTKLVLLAAPLELLAAIAALVLIVIAPIILWRRHRSAKKKYSHRNHSK